MRKKKLNIMLHYSQRRRLREIKEKTGAKSDSAVLRDAIECVHAKTRESHAPKVRNYHFSLEELKKLDEIVKRVGYKNRTAAIRAIINLTYTKLES